MNLYDGSTLAEYDHVDTIGHEFAVSAEHGMFEPDHVVLAMLNLVTDTDGNPEPDLRLTAAQARDLAASLILAADHLDGRAP